MNFEIGEDTTAGTFLRQVQERLAQELPEARPVLGLKVFLCDEDGEGGERDDIPMMHGDECLRNMQAHFEPGDGFEAVLFSGCKGPWPRAVFF